jgi:hypothetical protein
MSCLNLVFLLNKEHPTITEMSHQGTNTPAMIVALCLQRMMDILKTVNSVASCDIRGSKEAKPITLRGPRRTALFATT